MDVNKLRADLEASQALATEAQGKITALNGEIAAKDTEITQLRADVASANAKASDAEKALATANDDHKLATAKLEGRLEEAQTQVAKLTATAKTVGVQAAEITRSNAVTEPFDNLPDGSARGAGKTDTSGLTGRQRAAAAINHQFTKPTSA